MSWILIFLIALVIGVVVLLYIVLPKSITSNIAILGTAAAFITTIFTVYSSERSRRMDNDLHKLDMNDKYWNDIFASFLLRPDLNDVYKKVFNTNLSSQEHALYNIMMQKIENLIEKQNIGRADIDESWISFISQWIYKPEFQEYWKQSKTHFSIDTQRFVSTFYK